MPKPTLIDVGRRAGVSAITVSRALRTPDKVSDSLRKKIEDAVRALGYVPNQSASTLASSQTNSIVVMIPSVTNNVFSDVLKGIEAALKETKFTIQIGNTRYDPLEEERILRSFLNPTPAGVILTGKEQTEATLKMLGAVDVPVVQIMDVAEKPIDKIVGFSHEAAASAATEHLFDQGYKNVGFIGAQMDPRSQMRLTGFKKALGDKGRFSDECIATTNQPSNVALGALLFNKLANKFPNCDAVFCNNDDLALGVLFECQRRGISVPNDFGICGFNDLGVTSETVPAITSISTPLHKIGLLAGETFLDVGQTASEKTIDLGFEIKVRESTARN